MIARGPALAVGAAVLFGASAPLAKMMGSSINPWLLAGLLYLGSGVGLAAWRRIRDDSSTRSAEASLQGSDWRLMAAIIIFGGVAGPVLLMFGLQHVEATTASLLLNVEGVATMTIAWVVYRESVDRRLLLGAAAIVAGAVVLSWNFATVSLSSGALAIVAASICWGIDNNLTRKLSAADPVQIAMFKGLAAGVTNTLLGLIGQTALPAIQSVAAAVTLGFVAYGASLVLFVLALRELGAARTGAYFSTAPFVGAALSIPLLAEPVTWSLTAAGALMALGVWLHLTEDHEHLHEHEMLTHEHSHRHDDHHQHTHDPDDPLGEPHNHVHTHQALSHRHSHYPDIHHRHGH